MVKQSTHNRPTVGSIPTRPTFKKMQTLFKKEELDKALSDRTKAHENYTKTNDDLINANDNFNKALSDRTKANDNFNKANDDLINAGDNFNTAHENYTKARDNLTVD